LITWEDSMRVIAGIRIPDSKLAAAALDLVKIESHASIYKHVLRTFVFGGLAARAEGIGFDEELFLSWRCPARSRLDRAVRRPGGSLRGRRRGRGGKVPPGRRRRGGAERGCLGGDRAAYLKRDCSPPRPRSRTCPYRGVHRCDGPRAREPAADNG